MALVFLLGKCDHIFSCSCCWPGYLRPSAKSKGHPSAKPTDSLKHGPQLKYLTSINLTGVNYCQSWLNHDTCCTPGVTIPIPSSDSNEQPTAHYGQHELSCGTPRNGLGGNPTLKLNILEEIK